MINRFLTAEFYDPPPRPERIYARIDQIEPLPEPRGEAGPEMPERGRRRILFDSVDANWFDENRRGEYDDRAYFAEISLAVLEIDVGPSFSEALGGINHVGPEEESRDDASWFEIYLADRDMGGSPAVIYRNLFVAGEDVVVMKAVQVPQDVQALLEDAFALEDIYEATPEEIEATLARIGTIKHAAVYDVGQGNCNGFCGPYGGVSAYYDLGGGILGNRGTFPSALSRFCFTSNPPIILSHWDWDHWSSANRDPRALARTWIVPRQSLGAVHRAFAANVIALGRLLVWPRAVPDVQSGQVRMLRCNGNGKNHSGLAVILDGPGKYAGQHMLFPGDARYSVIPQYKNFDYTAVVAPHHGADMRNRYAPPCPGQNHCRLAYSYGPGNSFSHAFDITRNDHQKSGWLDPAAPLYTSGSSLVRETENRSAQSNLGHIMLRWDVRHPMPQLPCQGNCDLSICQL